MRQKALNSLCLAVDHFNCLWDVGRTDTVLMLLDHSFEMLLKASILHRGGTIRDRGEKNTIGFDTCVRRALSDERVRFLTDEQALTLQVINGLRDAAQHHLIDLSEGHLYLHAQAGLTLFGDIYQAVFNEKLSSRLPDRTLPVSTTAQVDPGRLFAEEAREVARLLRPGTRRRTEALARLRPIAVLDATIRGEKVQPGEGQLRALGRKIAAGANWNELFPGIAAIRLTVEGYGPSLALRLTKREGIPVQLVPEGTEDAFVIAVKRVDELGFYSLSPTQLAEKIGLTPPKATAAVRYLNLAADPECFKEVKLGNSRFKRYSPKAIEKIQAALADPGLDAMWTACRPRARTKV